MSLYLSFNVIKFIFDWFEAYLFSSSPYSLFIDMVNNACDYIHWSARANRQRFGEEKNLSPLNSSHLVTPLIDGLHRPNNTELLRRTY